MTTKKLPNTYQVITDRIIAKLEEGIIPWRKPWNGESGIPRNLASKKAYRGINVFLLACCTDFDSPYWLTYKQAKQAGGQVRKGEAGMPVVYWNWIDTKDKESGKDRKVPFIKHYTVFNSSQIDWEEGKEPELPKDKTYDFTPLEQCENIARNYPNSPSVTREGTRAYYRPSADQVAMPTENRFKNSEGFYSTLFHELTHSTGHSKRLNRDGIESVAAFGSATYSKEELIAEMGAAFLCGHCRIENVLDNQASYLANWLKVLRKDSKLIVQSAAAAQKAVDHILDIKWE